MEHDNLLPCLGFLKLQLPPAAAGNRRVVALLVVALRQANRCRCGLRRSPSDTGGFAAPCKLAATLAASSAKYASGACSM
jgi:hypothetical protein